MNKWTFEEGKTRMVQSAYKMNVSCVINSNKRIVLPWYKFCVKMFDGEICENKFIANKTSNF